MLRASDIYRERHHIKVDGQVEQRSAGGTLDPISVRSPSCTCNAYHILFLLCAARHICFTPPSLQVNQLIVAGQYWRLITPAFLHGNLVHLAINCASLNALGGTLEGLSGRERLASVYMVAAVTGNLASFWGSPSVSLGASGAARGWDQGEL